MDADEAEMAPGILDSSTGKLVLEAGSNGCFNQSAHFVEIKWSGSVATVSTGTHGPSPIGLADARALVTRILATGSRRHLGTAMEGTSSRWAKMRWAYTRADGQPVEGQDDCAERSYIPYSTSSFRQVGLCELAGEIERRLAVTGW